MTSLSPYGPRRCKGWVVVVPWAHRNVDLCMWPSGLRRRCPVKAMCQPGFNTEIDKVARKAESSNWGKRGMSMYGWWHVLMYRLGMLYLVRDKLSTVQVPWGEC